MVSLSPEGQLLSGSAIELTLDNFLEEVIDLTLLIPELIGILWDSLSPDWDVPGVFDDSMSIPPGSTTWTPWFSDHPVPPEAASFFLDDWGVPGGYSNPISINGPAIGRNTFTAILCLAIIGKFGKYGLRKSSALTALVFNKLFGVKAKIAALDDKVDILLDYADQVSVPQGSETTEGMEEMIKNQFEVLKSILGNADTEFTSLITGLLTDRRGALESIVWTEGVIDPLKISED